MIALLASIDSSRLSSSLFSLSRYITFVGAFVFCCPSRAGLGFGALGDIAGGSMVERLVDSSLSMLDDEAALAVFMALGVW